MFLYLLQMFNILFYIIYTMIFIILISSFIKINFIKYEINSLILFANFILQLLGLFLWISFDPFPTIINYNSCYSFFFIIFKNEYLGFNLTFGIDGIALVFIELTLFVFTLCFFALNNNKKYTSIFFVFLLILELSLILFFFSLDVFKFFVYALNSFFSLISLLMDSFVKNPFFNYSRIEFSNGNLLFNEELNILEFFNKIFTVSRLIYYVLLSFKIIYFFFLLICWCNLFLFFQTNENEKIKTFENKFINAKNSHIVFNFFIKKQIWHFFTLINIFFIIFCLYNLYIHIETQNFSALKNSFSIFFLLILHVLTFTFNNFYKILNIWVQNIKILVIKEKPLLSNVSWDSTSTQVLTFKQVFLFLYFLVFIQILTFLNYVKICSIILSSFMFFYFFLQIFWRPTRFFIILFNFYENILFNNELSIVKKLQFLSFVFKLFVVHLFIYRLLGWWILIFMLPWTFSVIIYHGFTVFTFFPFILTFYPFIYFVQLRIIFYKEKKCNYYYKYFDKNNVLLLTENPINIKKFIEKFTQYRTDVFPKKHIMDIKTDVTKESLKNSTLHAVKTATETSTETVAKTATEINIKDTVGILSGSIGSSLAIYNMFVTEPINKKMIEEQNAQIQNFFIESEAANERRHIESMNLKQKQHQEIMQKQDEFNAAQLAANISQKRDIPSKNWFSISWKFWEN